MSSSIKVLLTGDENVGKSSMILRLNHNKFSDTYVPTIGVEFCYTDINKNHLKIWDTAGQERFRIDAQTYLRNNPGKVHINVNYEYYYSNADVVLYVYDMTNKASFDYLDKHIADVQKLCPANTVQYLVATKSDKPNRDCFTFSAVALVAKFNLKAYYEVSSKSGESVQNMFHDMVEKYEPETSVVDELLGKPEMTLVDELLVELSEISKKVDSITERLKTLKQ